jgi:antitoxin-like ribbon-helix-helix protein
VAPPDDRPAGSATAVKILAARERRTINEMIAEALEGLFEKTENRGRIDDSYRTTWIVVDVSYPVSG